MASKKSHLQEKQLGHFRRQRQVASDPLFEIGIAPPPKGSRHSAKTVCGQLKAAILDGRLVAGAKLPPTRKAGTYFGVSRNTASQVYERLKIDGFVTARRGSGNYVAVQDASPAQAARLPARPGGERRLNEFWLRSDVMSAMNFWQDPPAAPARRAPSIDFRPAMVDSTLFPFDVFRRVSAKQLRGLEKRPASYRSAQGNQGSFPLRRAISKHIALTRAVVCQPEDLLVTSGAQQAFDLLARILVTPNKTVVAFEDPGYPPMRVSFAAAGARLVPVGVDREGLIVDKLPDDAAVICVTPSHQFPLGVTMSPRRRLALVEFARARGAVIIEDDYDGEFRYDAAPLEALRRMDAADVVFYVGTFSKCMLSALRLGFIAAPGWAMKTLVSAKNCLDWHCSIPVQRAAAGFIAEGHLTRHVRRVREIYRQRRSVLLASLDRELGAWLEPIPSLYGMHIAVTTRTPIDLDAVTTRLSRHNVRMHSLKRYFFAEPSWHGLILGYGTCDVAQIRRGMAFLLRALQD